MEADLTLSPYYLLVLSQWISVSKYKPVYARKNDDKHNLVVRSKQHPYDKSLFNYQLLSSPHRDATKGYMTKAIYHLIGVIRFTFHTDKHVQQYSNTK